MTKRRRGWDPYALPHVRRAHVEGAARRVGQGGRALATLPTRPGSLLEQVARSAPDAARVALAHADRLVGADLYWITGPMARVALDASLDMPSVTWSQVLPGPAGFIAFAEPLPPIPLAPGRGARSLPRRRRRKQA